MVRALNYRFHCAFCENDEVAFPSNYELANHSNGTGPALMSFRSSQAPFSEQCVFNLPHITLIAGRLNVLI
jgi:hypothetical protein